MNVITDSLGWVTKLLSRNKLCIATYHRVLSEPDPLLPSEPTSHTFAEHLKWLKSHANVLDLNDAVVRLKSGRLPPNSICITFDDGYLNNLTVAGPELLRQNLPATCFVTTRSIDSGIMWNDLVIESVRALPQHCDLSSIPIKPNLGCINLTTNESRRALINKIIKNIKYLDLADREAIGYQLLDISGLRTPPRLMLTYDQVRDLETMGIRVGGHTHNHSILARLSDQDAAKDIAENMALLTSIVSTRIDAFAYPNGKLHTDFLPRDALLVKDAGYSCAVSTEWGAATGSNSRFTLPRFTITESTEHQFLVRLLKLYIRAAVD